jgi:hypothetical protein
MYHYLFRIACLKRIRRHADHVPLDKVITEHICVYMKVVLGGISITLFILITIPPKVTHYLRRANAVLLRHPSMSNRPHD